jgi:hypothetical protein
MHLSNRELQDATKIRPDLKKSGLFVYATRNLWPDPATAENFRNKVAIKTRMTT